MTKALPPWTLSPPYFSMDLLKLIKQGTRFNSSHELWHTFVSEVYNYKNSVVIYTYSSKTENSSPCVIIFNGSYLKYKLCSIFMIELAAIFKALQLGISAMDETIIICSDSLSASNLLVSHTQKNLSSIYHLICTLENSNLLETAFN